MTTMAEKIIYHRETKLIECICGYVGTSHKCQKDLKKLSLFDTLKGVLSVKISCIVKSIIQRDGIKMLMDI